jgi:hypothetical protein
MSTEASTSCEWLIVLLCGQSKIIVDGGTSLWAGPTISTDSADLNTLGSIDLAAGSELHRLIENTGRGIDRDADCSTNRIEISKGTTPNKTLLAARHRFRQGTDRSHHGARACQKGLDPWIERSPSLRSSLLSTDR